MTTKVRSKHAVIFAALAAVPLSMVWAQPAPAPNARIGKAHQVIRETYEKVMDGLEAVAANAPDAAGKVGEIDRTSVTR